MNVPQLICQLSLSFLDGEFPFVTEGQVLSVQNKLPIDYPPLQTTAGARSCCLLLVR